jgi:hypothetical protein
MTITQKILRCAVLAIIAACPVRAASADDNAVYESLQNVPIGSIFFAPSTRIRLDKRRERTAASTGDKSESRFVAGRHRKNDAAGYIVGRSGEQRVYLRGDFVVVAGSVPTAFVGDVKITKTISAPQLHPEPQVETRVEEQVDEAP